MYDNNLPASLDGESLATLRQRQIEADTSRYGFPKPRHPSRSVSTSLLRYCTRSKVSQVETTPKLKGSSSYVQQQSSMANRHIFTRAYSENSAAQLISAKGPNGSLSHMELLEEFRNHANKWNREATALVSVSDRIIDTVKRAFDKYCIDGEPAEDIWIVFIEVQSIQHEKPVRFHAAHLLAEECELPKPILSRHEVVFERAVPEEYVLHRVSLQTLMGRGLGWVKYFEGSDGELRHFSTDELRCSIAKELQPCDPWSGSWEVGIYLASFAEFWGQSSSQLDCLSTFL